MEQNIKSIFLSLYCMVLADGIADAKELEVLYRIGKDYYNVTPEMVQKEIMSAGTVYPECTTLKDKVSLLYHLAQIAWADGEIQDEERDLLEKYTIKQGFAPENAPEIINFILDEVHNNVPLENVLKKITND